MGKSKVQKPLGDCGEFAPLAKKFSNFLTSVIQDAADDAYLAGLKTNDGYLEGLKDGFLICLTMTRKERSSAPAIVKRNIEICNLRRIDPNDWSLKKLAGRYRMTIRGITKILKAEATWRRLNYSLQATFTSTYSALDSGSGIGKPAKRMPSK